MSVVRRVLKRVTSQFPEKLLKRVLRESSALGGLAGQLPQGFENGIHLDFANDFHYIKSAGNDPSILPFTSLFTFTGGNQSMYRGSNGLLKASVTNTPRIEYDANGNLLGLLIEGARTNLCLQSEALGTTWSPSNATISTNAAVAPDGATTADALVENSANSAHQLLQTITFANSTAYTFSMFVKPAGRTFCVIQLPAAAFTANTFAYFNLSGAGSVGTTSGTPTATSITQYANGWRGHDCGRAS
jgi:hypothetical protein